MKRGNKLVTKFLKSFVKKLPTLIKKFKKGVNRAGPSLYFYQKVFNHIQQNGIEKSLEEESFIELLYAVLACWDMNTRGAKMKWFNEFKANILRNKERFIELSPFKLEKIPDLELKEVKDKLSTLYKNLDVMESGGKLVANSKIMHFLLPDLVMPMDRGTLKFFYGNGGESKNKFIEVFDFSWHVANKIDLTQYLDKKQCLSIPKIIDNAIREKREK